ncbi:MAG: AraC family transcriptional regulator [Clostridia bacterium]|nr:AraC family transcriptional regulator [Clostridia bacterium]
MIIFVACERFASDSGFVHIRRRMRYSELILMTKGTMYLAQDDTCVEVNEGDLVHFCANHLHYGWKKSSLPVEFYWIHFMSPDFESTPLPLLTHLKNPSEILRRFITLRDVYSRSAEDANCAMTLLLHDIENDFDFVKAQQGSLRDKIVAWIHSHFVENINVATLSQEFGYSCDYISRQVRQKTGVGAKEYITRCRISSAKSILLYSELNIESIAHSCGFPDTKQFYKLFKRFVGMTPTEFRHAPYSEE